MFWIHGEDLPPGVGSEPFCPMHLAYLAFFLALTVLSAPVCRKMDPGCRKKADRILGSLVFLFGLGEYGVTALVGRFSLYTLPIHVCSLMIFLCLIHALTDAARPGSFAAKLHRFLGAVLFHPGILGALAALLFPDWLYYPFWNYVSVCSFMAHGLLLVYGVSVIIKAAQAPDQKKLFLRDLRDSALFMGLGAAAMALFDRAVGANYWFMAGPSEGSPFAGVYARGGYGAYLLAFGLTALAVTGLWYGLRYWIFVRGRKR